MDSLRAVSRCAGLGAVLLLVIFKILGKLASLLVLLLIALVIFTYVSCWPMGSDSAWCAAIRVFLP